MQYTKLGRTGLDVSRLCLGCMSYGEPDRGNHPWTLGEAASRPFLKKALDLGINFFDTANVYSDGTSEEIVGRALLDFARRDEVVIATKVHGRMRQGPNGAGLSRKAILAEIDASLQRLGTDYVDLYQIHRWDSAMPIEETLEALNDVVRAGKALTSAPRRCTRGSSRRRCTSPTSTAGRASQSMQNHVNLLYREEEREMLPLCRAEGIGVIPWSPLARGRLTRDWDAASARSETDDFGSTLYAKTADADRKVVEALAAVATRLGRPRAQVALAWVLAKPEVTAPIIGATRLEQLDDAVAALTLELAPEDIAELEAPYVPHPVIGHE